MITNEKKQEALDRIRIHRKLFRKFHVKFWRIMRYLSRFMFYLSGVIFGALYISASFNHDKLEINVNLMIAVLGGWMILSGVFNNNFFSHRKFLRILDFPNRWSKRLIENLDAAES